MSRGPRQALCYGDAAPPSPVHHPPPPPTPAGPLIALSPRPSPGGKARRLSARMAQSTPWRSHQELALTTSWTRASSSPSRASAPRLPAGASPAASMGTRGGRGAPGAAAAAPGEARSARARGGGRGGVTRAAGDTRPLCHGTCRAPGLPLPRAVATWPDLARPGPGLPSRRPGTRTAAGAARRCAGWGGHLE